MSGDPFLPFVSRQGFLLLDGGLATELEARGCDLNHELWSARVLIDDPIVIWQVHYDYLVAGSDCIVSTSYQATFEGLARLGLADDECVDVLQRSVRLACDARDRFWSDEAHRAGRLRPLVAASVGPYGAYLADGSEYRGQYGLSADELYAFHQRRWHILAQSGADLMACETIPSAPEVTALARLVRETPDTWAWISLNCSDEAHLSDGSPLEDTLAALSTVERLAAVGVNCVAPELVPGFIVRARRAMGPRVMVYPNSGERYDAASKRWLGLTASADFGTAAREWLQMGATCLGGCCRTGPHHIAQMRSALVARS